MNRKFALLPLVALTAFAGTSFASATTKVSSVDVHSNYVEIATTSTVCSGLSGDWGKRPRMNLSEGVRAELTMKLAMAALLADKNVWIESTSSGGRCYIDYLQLNK